MTDVPGPPDVTVPPPGSEDARDGLGGGESALPDASLPSSAKVAAENMETGETSALARDGSESVGSDEMDVDEAGRQEFVVKKATEPIGMDVVPYGVLGEGTGGRLANEPDEETAFVDPAGLLYIQEFGPSGAGGAARVIYRWLGIDSNEAFPDEVRDAITETLQAMFHAYGEDGSKKCIHVVGPNFGIERYTADEAVEELATAYLNVFTEFCKSKLKVLRLLPISGGIFSGPFKPRIATLSANAIVVAYERLDEDQKRHMQQSKKQMCIFDGREVDEFQQAFRAGGILVDSQAASAL